MGGAAKYPTELEHELRLADGRTVHVRPVRPDDRDEMRRAITTADPETIHNRFLGGAPPHNDASLRRLVELDYDRRLAVAAFTGEGHGVGIGRYEGRSGDSCAEIAVAVDPAWRHVGLATDLVRTLAVAARARGIDTLTATALTTNWDVQDIVAAVGAPYTQQRDGDVIADVIDIGGRATP